jgi:hypothetical protein
MPAETFLHIEISANVPGKHGREAGHLADELASSQEGGFG